ECSEKEEIGRPTYCRSFVQQQRLLFPFSKENQRLNVARLQFPNDRSHVNIVGLKNNFLSDRQTSLLRLFGGCVSCGTAQRRVTVNQRGARTFKLRLSPGVVH